MLLAANEGPALAKGRAPGPWRPAGLAKLPNSGTPLERRTTIDVGWPLDEGGGDVLREASGTGDGEELAGCARGEFRWEPVDDVVRGSGQEHGGRL